MDAYSFDTYTQLFKYITTHYDNPTFLNYLKDGEYESISTADFKQRVSYLALALEEFGVKEYDSVALFAKPSPCWLIFDFALQLVKAVSVPIFEDISQKNLDFELHDSQIKYIFTDHTKYIYDIDDEITIIGCNIVAKNKKFITVSELMERGKLLYKTKSDEIENMIHSVGPDYLFSVVYTSGNTGIPKGVELTQSNIVSQLHAIHQLYPLKKGAKALTLLPLAHIFERTVMSYYLSCGISIYFVDDVHNVAPLMKKVKPNIMTVVPRLLEKIYLKIEEKVYEKKGFEGLVARLAFQRARQKKYSKPTLIDKLFSKLVYNKFLESFGGELEVLVSGGANLDKELYNFFLNIGLPLYQGYGLTETSPVISVNYPGNNKAGTCGKPLPNVKVKLNKDNELLTKGQHVMRGYRNQEGMTQETIDQDGWLHTGDLASIDEEGYITIQSRKKELLKTSTGKYISAVAIEQAITQSKYIDYAIVVGNDRQFVTALLFMNPELVPKDINAETFYKQSDIKSQIIAHIKRVNATLDQWEKVVKYAIITNKISIDGGELTPSMKIRRNEIESKYKKIIDNMYK
ncbi:AMP-dependent synthetase/ligase [Candidatus Marinarcus aquaticus]|uniref:AMP-dependent synthetase n=1 Tax=Candidatus Marinarcus aquaticus TaxID=2044504 RepID=A0A4Q0XTC9_9BACT|nr:long-chain fatty acid--CoA ligase [Candidatus Marinarcus aquaticus]RXJ60827.1 AMP-dependent synthetase [Candidatus Marinarcus aquaticus]